MTNIFVLRIALSATAVFAAALCAAQTPALDKAKEDKAVAEAQAAAAVAAKAVYEAQAAAAEAKAKADIALAKAEADLAKAKADQQKAAADAEAAAAEAKAKAGVAQAKAEADLAKAIADQQKAAADATVAAQTAGAQVDLKAAEALLKQGDALNKLFPAFDAAKIRAPAPTTTEFKSQALAIAQQDARCLALEVAKKMRQDLEKVCPAKGQVVIVLEAASQRTAIRAYNMAEAQVDLVSRRIDDAIQQTSSVIPAGGLNLAGAGALVQFAGSLASLVSAVKSVYSTANATTTTFDDVLRAEVLSALSQSNDGLPVTFLDPRSTWPSIGVARDGNGDQITPTGLLKDLDNLVSKRGNAASRLQARRQDLAKLLDEAKLPGKQIDAARKAVLDGHINLLESVVKEASDLSAFLLKDDARFGNQSPLNLILDVRALSAGLAGAQCKAALDMSAGVHMVDTRAQDSALQFRQRVYQSSGAHVTWKLWNPDSGRLMSAGSKARRTSWARADEGKNEWKLAEDCTGP